jgi:hypothetical protein
MSKAVVSCELRFTLSRIKWLIPVYNNYTYITIQNHDFIYCFAWAWNMVSYIKGRTLIEDVLEKGAEENVLI